MFDNDGGQFIPANYFKGVKWRNIVPFKEGRTVEMVGVNKFKE